METDEAIGRWAARPGAVPLLALAAALPLLAPPIQPLIDLPGHLAQFHVADALGRSPTLARHFAFAWAPVPNLGVDLAVAALAPLAGVEPAARLVVAAIPALTAAGLLLVARAAHGGRMPATALLALPLAYSYPLAFGFLNSSLSVALALFAFAGWLALTRAGRPRARLALALAAAPVLFFAHIIGWGALGLMAGGATLAERWRAERPARALRDTALACLPLAWPLVFVALWRGGQRASTTGWLNGRLDAQWLAGLLRDGWAPWDLAGAALLLAVAALPVWRPRRFGWRPELGLAAAGLWLAALGLPSRLAGSEFASVRLLPVAVALSLLAVLPRRPLPRWAAPAALGFVAARWIGNGVALWLAGAAGAADLTALPHVEPGARVVAFVPLPCRPEWAPPRLQHLAAYAIVRRDASVNDDFGREEGQLLRRLTLADPVLGRLPEAPVLPRAGCPRAWPDTTLAQALAALPTRGFDYLWLIDVPAAARPRRGDLRPVWGDERSALYRLRPAAPPEGADVYPAPLGRAGTAAGGI